jgi:ABC-type metal ion transport system substrate-binding protein
MKKLFAILAVSAFVFAACGQKAETEEPVVEEATVETTVVEEPAAEEQTAEVVEGEEAAAEEVVAE